MSESSVLDINPQLEVILKSIDLEDSVLLEPILNLESSTIVKIKQVSASLI